ncbi:MAG: hypothetical protein ACWGNV_18195 [Bacteroidales bacterium]
MKQIVFLAGVLWLFSGNLPAQEYVPTFEDTLEVYEGLFSREEPLDLTLKLDLKQLQRSRRDEKYQDAEMTCHVNESFDLTHPVRIKTRGNYRRDNCTYPPFWINIRHSGIEADSLHDVVRMKMVVRCRSSKQYESYILREYLVYKIFNLITPLSYRVRLVRLTYIDTGRKNEETEDWAFLIEPDELMEKRLQGKMIKSDHLSMRTVNPHVMDDVAMFQYMIGTSDYSVAGRHNLRIIAVKDPDQPQGFIVVPYDFDYTGLVNAHYAVPREGLPITSVRERYFLGPCRSEEEYKAVVDEFATYYQPIIKYLENFEYLEEAEREDMIEYIKDFYRTSGKNDFISRRILSTCRSYE